MTFWVYVTKSIIKNIGCAGLTTFQCVDTINARIAIQPVPILQANSINCTRHESNKFSKQSEFEPW